MRWQARPQPTLAGRSTGAGIAPGVELVTGRVAAADAATVAEQTFAAHPRECRADEPP